MKKKDAMKWVAALRSGIFKQGFGALQVDNKFCCLGVLNEIFPKKDLAGLSNEVLINFRRIGLPQTKGFIVFDHDLTDLNDGANLSAGRIKLNFNEIADIIQLKYIEKAKLR